MLRGANWYVFALNPWLVEKITVVRANELQGQTGAIDPCHVAAILDLKQAWTGIKIAKTPGDLEWSLLRTSL